MPIPLFTLRATYPTNGRCAGSFVERAFDAASAFVEHVVVADHYSGFGTSVGLGASTGAGSAGLASGSALVRMRAASWAKEWTGALPAFC